jgi:hypothetical protein
MSYGEEDTCNSKRKKLRVGEVGVHYKGGGLLKKKRTVGVNYKVAL